MREKTVQQITDLFGVPRSTVYGHYGTALGLPVGAAFGVHRPGSAAAVSPAKSPGRSSSGLRRRAAPSM
ncbi:hypothetical protein ACIQ6K_25020 [Streptomyces sp. NPDC096354]|uniref:hypothetical protein n=1 Tax=Streptomyces sp. NPDC096354 TaxID=3366088 RepID=UPI00381AD937